MGPEIAVILLAISFALMAGGMHRINEGHLGAYYRFGVL
jgi:hypothetical protein